MPREFRLGLANQIKNFLDQEEKKYYFDPIKGVFRLKVVINKKCLLRHVDLNIFVDEDGFLVCAVSPINVPEETRDEVAIFLTRINYQFKNGDFEMDYSDGEVMFKVYCYCGDQMPSLDVIDRYYDIPLFTFKRYSEGLVDVILGKKTGKEAAEDSEESSVDVDALLEGLDGLSEGDADALLEKLKTLADALGIDVDDD